jgi:hypothetical protein
MECTSESAEIANHTIRDVGDLDEPRIVGLGNQRTVRHRQTYTVRNKFTVQEKVKVKKYPKTANTLVLVLFEYLISTQMPSYIH